MPTGEVVRKKDASKVAATGGAKAAGADERKPAASAIKKKQTTKSAKKTPVKSSASKTIAKTKTKPGYIDIAVAVKRGEKDDKLSDGESGAIAFSTDEYPQLTLDEGNDYSDLAAAFKKPLFDNPSRPLEIAYSHHTAVVEKRTRAQKKKNTVVREYNSLREKFRQKKVELSLADDKVQGCNQQVGMWTRKVFDLELAEECEWNANLHRLKIYVAAHGKLPPTSKKATGEEEKALSAWLEEARGQKNQDETAEDATADEESPKKKPRRNKNLIRDYPHRIESLAKLGVVLEKHTENKWETMFQRLLIYKEEQGTLRFPSDEQCAATGDEELIALQKWVKSQVLAFRYGKKKRNPEIVKTQKLLDIGFDFEKWFAKPNKGGGRKKKGGEKAATMDYDNDDRKMPAKEEAEV